MTSWVIVDQSEGAQTSSGESLSPDVLSDVAAAIEIQCNRDYAPNVGGTSYGIRTGKADEVNASAGERGFLALPTIPVDGAVAYHDVADGGVPDAFDAVTDSDTVCGPGNSFSVSASHEILEADKDPGCNLFADTGQGSEVALEEADAVESQTYPITVPSGRVVYVSNFLLPSFFIVGAPPPYDFMTLACLHPEGDVGPTAPFTIAPGGNYQVERDSGVNERQVFARHTHEDDLRRTEPGEGTRRSRRKAKDRHPQSRAHRLGVRV